MSNNFLNKEDREALIRTIILAVFVLLLAGIILYRLFVLQIVKGDEYLADYKLKIEKTREIEAIRGDIYDKNGVLLAFDDLSYTVKMEDVFESKEELNKNIYTLIKMIEENGDSIIEDFNIYINEANEYEFDISGSSLLRFKADIYGYKTVDELTYKEETATAEEMMNYLAGPKRYKVGDYEYNDKNERVKDSEGDYIFQVGKGYSKQEMLQIVTIRYAISLTSYQKYIRTTIAENISEKTIALIYENMNLLQGVTIEEDSIRKYIDGPYFSHILGYTGKISPEELIELNEGLKVNGEDKEDYSRNDVVGKTGIEQYLEYDLQGESGKEVIYVDVMGRVLEVKSREEPKVGNHVYLSIDSELQKRVYNAIERQIADLLALRIKNVKTYMMGEDETSADIVIPIYDVYYALFDNNVISIPHMKSDDAKEIEQKVYQKYLDFKKDRDDVLNEEFTQKYTAYSELSKEYREYQDAIIELLKDYEILDTSKIDKEDEVYIKFTKDNSISMGEYLKYSISKNWIDVTRLDIDLDYVDSDEIYSKLLSYISLLKDESGSYRKLYYKNMIHTDKLTGKDICFLLLEQDVIFVDPEVVQKLERNAISAYDFMLDRIKNIDITPAQLALDPYAGSCVVTDVDNGKILALVTYPSYDNNKMANTVDADYYEKIRNDKSNPLFNYATQQRSAPGSTFKMVSTTAGLTDNVLSKDRMIRCTGVFDTLNPVARCWIWPNGTHGLLNASGALKHSCNVFFYQAAYELSLDESGNYNEQLGLDKLRDTADLFGLTQKSGVEIGEYAPNVSDELPILSAIGQGTNSFTTVGLSRYVTAIANKGNTYDLSLLKKTTDARYNTIKEFEPKLRNNVELSEENWNIIHEGMRMALENVSYYSDIPFTVAGKTGTAQENTKRADHALAVGFAPYNNPEISITSRIAFGYKAEYASKLSAEVIRIYFEDEMLKAAEEKEKEKEENNIIIE